MLRDRIVSWGPEELKPVLNEGYPALVWEDGDGTVDLRGVTFQPPIVGKPETFIKEKASPSSFIQIMPATTPCTRTLILDGCKQMDRFRGKDLIKGEAGGHPDSHLNIIIANSNLTDRFGLVVVNNRNTRVIFTDSEFDGGIGDLENTIYLNGSSHATVRRCVFRNAKRGNWRQESSGDGPGFLDMKDCGLRGGQESFVFDNQGDWQIEDCGVSGSDVGILWKGSVDSPENRMIVDGGAWDVGKFISRAGTTPVGKVRNSQLIVNRLTIRARSLFEGLWEGMDARYFDLDYFYTGGPGGIVFSSQEGRPEKLYVMDGRYECWGARSFLQPTHFERASVDAMIQGTFSLAAVENTNPVKGRLDWNPAEGSCFGGSGRGEFYQPLPVEPEV
jgi:hypothetical protein